MKTNNSFKNLEGSDIFFSQVGYIAVFDFMNMFKIVTEVLAFLICALSHPEILEGMYKNSLP